jgi:hypothetical protein
MRFRLLYEGDLYSSQPHAPTHALPANVRLADHKHKIRKQFHGQVRKAFQGHPVLSTFSYCKSCKKNHGLQSPDGRTHNLQKLDEVIIDNVGGPIFGFQFCPLVSDVLNLHCSLNILILRRDAKSGVYSAGDLDNRLKTLIDGLAMPKVQAQLGSFTGPVADEQPFFTLMRDDNIVSALKVETDVLYRDEDGCGNQLGDSYVYAVIDVEVKPSGPNHLNLGFF